jgi:hypothetical protein
MKQNAIKVLLGLAAFFCLTSTIYAQKDIYESSLFDELSRDHQVLAIIPFLTQLELEQELPKAERKRLAQNEGYAVQEALEIYFSNRRKRKKFQVEFQNTQDTNALLLQKGITYANIDIYTTKELCEILKVDGVISGNLTLNILLSKGISTKFNLWDYLNRNSNYGRIGIKISDGKSGKLLWRFEKEITKKSGKNTTELIDKMMKQASRKFPYDKEKKERKKKKKKED